MRVKNNTIGSLTGIVGDLCLYEVGGRLVCRSLPRRDKKKASAAQITCRNTFASRVGIAQSVKYTLLRRVWKYTEFPVGMNSLNHFLKINKGAFGRTDRIIYPQLFIVSEGELSPVLNLEVMRDGGVAAMHWDLQNDDGQANPDDRLNVVFLYNEKSLIVVKTDVARLVGCARVEIPFPESPDLEGYVFWSSPDNKSFSSSVYWKG